jgi:hypothetical protein
VTWWEWALWTYGLGALVDALWRIARYEHPGWWDWLVWPAEIAAWARRSRRSG